jgi:hypothetical protein
MLQNLIKEYDNDSIIYLGGKERFSHLFFRALNEMKEDLKLTKNSGVMFNVNKSGGYDYVQNYGEESLKGYITALLPKIPYEWVFIDNKTYQKLQLIIRVEISEKSENSFKFFIEFKVKKNS